MGSHYRVVTYANGKEVNRFDTTRKSDVIREYKKTATSSLAVRVWVNGEKLPYIVSNSIFDDRRERVNATIVGVNYGYDRRNGYAM